MKCDQCHSTISPEEACEHLGRTLCEDCYMEALSPARTCDPWTVHSARQFERHTGGQSTLTTIQKEILKVLKKSGGLTAQALEERLGGKLDAKALQVEFATLRHMEKVRAEKRGGEVILRMW